MMPAFARQVTIVERRRLDIAGTVQGVGFRPFVYRLATRLGLAGWVNNTSCGVRVEVEGPAVALDAFAARCRAEHPSHARIDDLRVERVAATGATSFTIAPSEADGSAATGWLPDLATCPACLAEIRDPASRRHRHPFASCTACGPRDSIMLGLPYDRDATTMRGFAMCADCRAEYTDPGDRRFHAQSIACPACGPTLELRDGAGNFLADRDGALVEAAGIVRDGGILALKALGGFQLIVDARNAAAVARLRARKRRPDKPFAVMAPDLAAARAIAVVSAIEADTLAGPAAPIVLLRRDGDPDLAPGIAPGLAEIGVMLPPTPLHHLFLDAMGGPVVATSGNLAGEPLATETDEALDRLGGIADAFLTHDRPIARPLDDSVVRVIAGTPTVLRAGRGIAPVAVDLPRGVARPARAHGGHLKAAPAMAVGRRAALGAHVGDLDGSAARQVFRRRLADLETMTGRPPAHAVHDAHPDYASTAMARDSGLPPDAVQHHAAHLAACLADTGRAPPAVGAIWDGTGDGGDGTIWGGEVLRLEADGTAVRLAHLRPFPLPGGEAAVREPRRAALGLLYAMNGVAAFDAPAIVGAFTPAERRTLRTAMPSGVSAPVTTSAGRLMDGLAWLLGVADTQTYEGQAAMQLEAAASAAHGSVAEAPDLVLQTDLAPVVLDWAPLVAWVAAARQEDRYVADVAAAIHRLLARAIVRVATHVNADVFALSGGCFQNRLLTETVVTGLRAQGIAPLTHARVPPNDGGLALGQLAMTAFRTAEG
jgi:hydrogenase maturation protein HypF